MKINGTTYTWKKDFQGGYDIFADRVWVGWSAGNATDARNTAREIARSSPPCQDVSVAGTRRPVA